MTQAYGAEWPRLNPHMLPLAGMRAELCGHPGRLQGASGNWSTHLPWDQHSHSAQRPLSSGSQSVPVCVTPGDIYQNLEALCLSQLGWGATGIWYFKAGDAGKHPAVHRIAPKQSVIWPKMSVTPKSCPVEMKTCSQKSLHRTVYRNSSLKYCKTQEKPKCASATREQINRDAP